MNELVQPFAGLVEGPDGSLYGTTPSGEPNNNGGIFRINLDGTGYAVLHNFAGRRAMGRAANPP